MYRSVTMDRIISTTCKKSRMCPDCSARNLHKGQKQNNNAATAEQQQRSNSNIDNRPENNKRGGGGGGGGQTKWVSGMMQKVK